MCVCRALAWSVWVAFLSYQLLGRFPIGLDCGFAPSELLASAGRAPGLEPCVPASTLAPGPERQGCWSGSLRGSEGHLEVPLSTRGLYLPAVASHLSPNLEPCDQTAEGHNLLGCRGKVQILTQRVSAGDESQLSGDAMPGDHAMGGEDAKGSLPAKRYRGLRCFPSQRTSTRRPAPRSQARHPLSSFHPLTFSEGGAILFHRWGN